MASGGSSSRAGSGGRTFDFGSDDVLCSYDDFGPQDPPNGRRSDPSAKVNFSYFWSSSFFVLGVVGACVDCLVFSLFFFLILCLDWI